MTIQMAPDNPDIARLARLSALQPDSAAAEQVRHDFPRILGLISELQSQDTSGVQPLAHPLAASMDIHLRLRPDTPEPVATQAERDARMANAPASHDGLFLVPAVIE